MKKFLSILCTFSVTLILFSFASCGQYGSENFRALTFEEMYFNAEHYSFAILKIDLVDPQIYCEATISSSGIPHKINNSDRRFSVLECTVEEDFFGRLESGTTVYLSILKETNEDNNEYNKAIRELFYKGQNIVAHFSQDIYNNVLASSKTDDICSFSYLSRQINLSEWNIIPFAEDEVDLNAISSFLEEQKISYADYTVHYGFTDYFSNGMSIENVSNNMRTFVSIKK